MTKPVTVAGHRRRRWSLLALCAGACATAAACARAPAAVVGTSAADLEAPPPILRLPADVRPRAYTLELDANPASQRFAGTVTIQLALAHAARVLWLHARGLNVAQVSARAGGAAAGAAPIAATFAEVTPDGLAKVTLAAPIGPGEATLVLRFDAPFDRRNEGFYKVVQGGDSYALTQFEPLSARLAFPCFDEPAFKAPLALTLTGPDTLVAVANGPVEREESLPDHRKRWRFQTTAPLPTYLYAWAIGPWDVVVAPPIAASGPRHQPLPLRGLAPRGHGGELAQSLALAPALVERLEGYFDIAYPFAKLDLLAAPDFQAGAMENAGLVTFADNLLLVDEPHAPVRLRELWVRVMAHELAHQWFGDLVTMVWWDDIWLNEAFAEWLCFPIAAAVRPQYHYPVRLAKEVESALREDALVSARRIRQTIEKTGDVRNVFDAVTYLKGASLIATFERYVGHEVFRTAIHDYLVAHAFGNGSVDDLLATLSRSSGRDIATPFRTFLDQPGVPLIAATRRCAGGKASLALQQSRFLPVGSQGNAHLTWQLPLCARYADGKSLSTACTLLAGKTGTLELPGKGCPAVVLPNAGGDGYYRWSLPSAELHALVAAPALTETERLSTAEALVAGYEAAVIPAADTLGLLAKLVRDPEPAVSSELLDLLEVAKDRLLDPADRPAIMKKTAEIYGPVLAKVGLEPRGPGEDVRVSERRATAAYALLAVAESAPVRKDLARLGGAYLGMGRGGDGRAHPEAIEMSLGRLALRAALESDPALFDSWIERLRTEETPLVRAQLLGALSADHDPVHAARLRELIVDPRLRTRERLDPIFGQMSDYRTRAAAWSWLKEHMDAVVPQLSFDDRARLPTIGRSFCSDAEAADLDGVFRPRVAALEGSERPLAQTLEAIHLCVALATAQRASAHQFFTGKPARR